MKRPYVRIAANLTIDGDRQQRMRALVDVLWEFLSLTGVSWVGFYVHEGRDALVLGPHRDKPACSPIGLHGACGRAFNKGMPLIVRDVANLREKYVVCDPRDRSEVVIPLLEDDGTCWGVLDLDSFEVGAFDPTDVIALGTLLRAVGLTSSDLPIGDPVVV